MIFQPNLACSFVIFQAMDDFSVQTKIREHILFTGFIVHVVCVRYLAGAVVLCFVNCDDKVNLHEKG